MKQAILYIWFQLATGICNGIAGEILGKYNGIEEIYNCNDFSFLGDKKQKYINRLENKDTSQAFEILKRCQSMGAQVVGYYDNLYPKSLRRIPTPPSVLYVMGDLKSLNGIPCVAVVGKRKMTSAGKDIAENFAYNFCKSGAYVISGLAAGIDTAAHRGAIMAGGYTVAVLGNPIGDVYPKENLKAFQTLYQRGAVISEMYPGCPRTKADFPNRNRIISGLSDAIVVIEAGESSGALITARHGLEQGKHVFAVPGAIGTENSGTNTLIKNGVPAATEPQDIISVLVLEYPEIMRQYTPSVTSKLRSYGTAPLTEEPIKEEPVAEIPVKTEIISATEEITALPQENGGNAMADKILSALSISKPISADELTQITGIAVSEIMCELTVMEIEGKVLASPGGRYTKAKA